MNVQENVIQPDPTLVDRVVAVFASLSQALRSKKPEELAGEADDLLNPMGFAIRTLDAYRTSRGGAAYTDAKTGMVMVDPKVLNMPPNEQKSILSHELVHRGQVLRVHHRGNFKAFMQRRHWTDKPSNARDRQLTYHADPYELMAYARDMIDELSRAQSKREVLDTLRSLGHYKTVTKDGHSLTSNENVPSSAAKRYIRMVRSQNPAAWNKFLRYAFGYAMELPDEHAARVAEALLED